MKNYKDPKMLFLKQMVQSVEYLRDCEEQVLYNIIFSLKPKLYEKDTLVLTDSHQANSIFFIEDGEMEVFTYFEGHEFLVDRLQRGSILNYRSFFLQDTLYCNVRTTVDTKLLELN